ncbi:choline ABC transporter ATP-binding protein [Acuticoccus sp. MNP-M23]|uniref:choline ABC transporter ATP-binding protein n=1 Tax=Acuticoccus sp. MNP-M23 TaxID=3072793 RepID=UPI0028154BF6|nr:choline ABC transporter ATP-binding protein [Acuticoccus sp. MNP-M23]WMS42664.1 choline ABC transporter ATP-binding protein [Acuticoccus sp. MNP-M23]
MSDALRFENVSIVFGDDPARALALADAGKSRAEIQEETGDVLGVHDCSLSVKPGEIVVLMGLSGSGKSTLLRAVNGLNPISRGSMLVDGGDGLVDIAAIDAATLRRVRRSRVAMVFQQFGLMPWRNVIDNVAFGLELSGMPRAKREETARAQLDLVGLSDWADRPMTSLSGGMQQRVGLARAFATDAPILLMDEPFSALDPLIRARLQDELLDLQGKLKRTIVFVSHDLDEAFKIGDRIAIMEGGRIVQCGTPGDIMRNPADDYVAAFVANMNPLTVLRARDIMRSGTAPVGAPEAAPGDLVEPLMDAIGGGQTVSVVDGGQPVGMIDAADVVAALAPGRPSAEPPANG